MHLSMCIPVLYYYLSNNFMFQVIRLPKFVVYDEHYLKELSKGGDTTQNYD